MTEPKHSKIKTSVYRKVGRARRNASRSGAFITRFDHRDYRVKRLFQIVASITSDCGGSANIVETKAQTIKNFGICCYRIECLFAEMCEFIDTGKDIPPFKDTILTRWIAIALGYAKEIGLSRQAREVLSLDKYLESRKDIDHASVLDQIESETRP